MYVWSSGTEAHSSASCVVSVDFWASGLMSVSFWSSKTAKLKCAVKSSSALSGVSRDAWFLAVCKAVCIWSYCSACEFCTIAIVYVVKVFFIMYNVSHVSVCRATWLTCLLDALCPWTPSLRSSSGRSFLPVLSSSDGCPSAALVQPPLSVNTPVELSYVPPGPLP